MDHYTIEPFDIHWSVRGKAGQGRIQALVAALDADLVEVISQNDRGQEARHDACQAVQLIRQARNLINKHDGFQGGMS